MALRLGVNNSARDTFDALGIGYGRTAKFLNY
jgi:hypothetical protein